MWCVLNDGNIRMKEHEKLGKYQGLGRTGESLKGEGDSGACGVNTARCNPQTGGVAIVDLWKNFRHLSPESTVRGTARILCTTPKQTLAKTRAMVIFFLICVSFLIDVLMYNILFDKVM